MLSLVMSHITSRYASLITPPEAAIFTVAPHGIFPFHLSPHRTINLPCVVQQDKVEEETTAGALELLGLDEELILEGGAAEVEGDGDAEEGDDDGNNDADGEVSRKVQSESEKYRCGALV